MHGHVGHMPYPMPVAQHKCNLNFNKLVILLYAWTRWPHAVSHVHCAPQVNILFIPFLIYLDFLYKNCDTFIRTDMLATCRIPCP